MDIDHDAVLELFGRAPITISKNIPGALRAQGYDGRLVLHPNRRAPQYSVEMVEALFTRLVELLDGQVKAEEIFIDYRKDERNPYSILFKLHPELQGKRFNLNLKKSRAKLVEDKVTWHLYLYLSHIINTSL